MYTVAIRIRPQLGAFRVRPQLGAFRVRPQLGTFRVRPQLGTFSAGLVHSSAAGWGPALEAGKLHNHDRSCLLACLLARSLLEWVSG